MKNKTVSVHIVTYNSVDDIIECLSAVLAQDYPLEKIVIVDNASADDSTDKVRWFYEQIKSGSAQLFSADHYARAPKVELPNIHLLSF